MLSYKRLYGYKFMFLVFILMSIPSMAIGAQTSDVDDLLNFLTEKGVIKTGDASAFKEELAKKKQKEAKDEKGFALTANNLLRLSGYTQIRYQVPENATSGFDIHRARLILYGNITDHIDYKLQPAFEGPSPKLLDAYMDYAVGQYLKFTAGQFKIPFSQENLISSAMLETIDRSQVIEALVARSKDVIGNQNGRDIGIQAGGNFLKLYDTYLFEYALAVLNGQGINTTDLNDQKDYVGRLLIHPIKDLAIGGDYYAGRYALAGITGSSYERTRIGAELAYIHDPVSLKAEYIRGRDGSKTTITTRQGWYVQGTCFLLAKKLQGVLKYDIYDSNVNVPNNTSTVYTIGLNWFFTTLTRIQVNYEIKDVDKATRNSNLLAAQLQVGF
ncbi:MAG: porin [bacterium]